MTPKDRRGELNRLYDMQEAIENIETQPEYAKGREAFDNNPRYQVWVLFHIERIGECASFLRQHYDYDNKHPELELKEAQGMRRRLLHMYWDTDLNLVWKAVLYLPELKEKLDKVVKEKELLRDQQQQKELAEKPEPALPFPEPKSRLEELANKRAIMRAESKLEKRAANFEKEEPEKEKSQEKERDL